jgi:hypothetical protein
VCVCVCVLNKYTSAFKCFKVRQLQIGMFAYRIVFE